MASIALLTLFFYNNRIQNIFFHPYYVKERRIKMSDNQKCNKCLTCRYLEYDKLGRAHVCVNAESEHAADFVSVEDSCEHHEERPKWERNIIDLVNLVNWLDEQRRGAIANPECYNNVKEIVDQLDIIEEYLWCNREIIEES